MKIHQDAPTEEVQIQIVPLIDVIFCILTFFILAALQLTRQQAINIDLPQANTATAQNREMLVVTVTSTGQTFVDKQPVDRNQLYQLVRDYHQKQPQGLLVLNASRVAFYNDVVQVLDLMRMVGGDRVALATIPAEGNQAPVIAPSPTLNPNIFGSPSPIPPFSPINPGQVPLPAPTGGGQPAQPGAAPLNPSLEVAPSPTLPGTTAPTPEGR